MKKIATSLTLLLPLFCAACGGSSAADLTSSAKDALNSGDSAKALEHFEQALAKLQPEDEGYLEAKMGAIEARIKGDAEAAASEFLELAGTSPDMVGVSQYSYLGGQMANSKAWLPAIDVLDAGIKRFGKEETKLVALLDKIRDEAESNEGVASKLAGLGYL